MKAFLSAAVLAFAAAGSTQAAAVEKRQSSGLTDADILNFALVLEHLEATFYSQALSNFSASDFEKAGYASNIRANIEQIAYDEAQHVSILTSALSAAGATPVQACTYDFGYKDVSSFLGLSQVLEGVGTSAYLGAAQFIQNKDYLTAAGAILVSEARHTAFIRYLNGYSPFVVVQTPLDPKSVQSIATPFFKSCPSGSSPPFGSFPAANVTSSGNGTAPGDTITVSFANSTSASSDAHCIFLSGLSSEVSTYQDGKCTIPSNLTAATDGQVYGVVSSASTFNDSLVLAGPFVLELSPKNNTASNGGSGSTGSSKNGTAGIVAAANTTTGGASKLALAGAASGLAGLAAIAALFL